MEFCSEKIPRNRLGMVSLFRGRKFRGIPRFPEESIPRLGTEGNGTTKISVTKNPAPANRIDSIFSKKKCFGRNSSILFHGTKFQVVFSSAEWCRTESREFASIFVPWYRILSIFLLCVTVRNGIPRVFCSAEQPEFRRNQPIVPSIPSSAEYNFLSDIANPSCDPFLLLWHCATHHPLPPKLKKGPSAD